jgi:hypothetical protein
MRPLKEQAQDPLSTNVVENSSFFGRYMPFAREKK